jgi:hypothetical protein
MRLTSVRAGDIIECDVRGRRFHALVIDPSTPPEGCPADVPGLSIRPFHQAITYRHVTARQVVGHWRKAGRRS